MENKKNILFRADGNIKIGLGHLYRIFALYEMLKADFTCIFITHKNSTLKVIPKEYNLEIIPENITLKQEAKWIARKFTTNNIVIADGYQFTSNYQKRIKQEGFKLVYIDDLVQEHMYADLVINHAPKIKKEDYKSESYTKFALGTGHAILRPLFLEAAKQKQKIVKINTAFVCFGGADPHDLTLKSTKILLKIEQFKKINIVIGAVYKNNEIFKLQKLNSKINIYKNLSEKELITIMQESDFAIVPASSILVELLAVKMIILSGYYVNNQKYFYNYTQKEKAIQGIGNFLTVDKLFFKEKIQEIFITDSQKMLKYQQKLIDGLSKKRILCLIKTLNNEI